MAAPPTPNEEKLPSKWAVVVAGRWNRAILTPHGIATRLFEQTPDVIEVRVPMDSVAPPAVALRQMTVIVSEDRLVIQPDENDYEQLAAAARHASQALVSLPETPCTAATFNIKVAPSEAQRTALSKLFNTHLDAQLKDAGYPIALQALQRRVEWEGGAVLVQVRNIPSNAMGVLFSFEKRSEDVAQLKDWLGTDVKRIGDVVSALMAILTRSVP